MECNKKSMRNRVVRRSARTLSNGFQFEILLSDDEKSVGVGGNPGAAALDLGSRYKCRLEELSLDRDVFLRMASLISPRELTFGLPRLAATLSISQTLG
jgi:hypothetical protein